MKFPQATAEMAHNMKSTKAIETTVTTTKLSNNQKF